MKTDQVLALTEFGCLTFIPTSASETTIFRLRWGLILLTLSQKRIKILLAEGSTLA